MTSNAMPPEEGESSAEEPALADPTEDFAEELFEPPETIIVAARMMWLGAALSVVAVLVGFFEIDEIKRMIADQLRSRQEYSAHEVNVIYLNLVISSIVLAAAEAAVWIWMARKNQAGRRWARKCATALGATNIAGFASLVVVGNILPSQLITTAANVVLAIVVLVLLWLPDSSAYYYLSGIRRPRR